MESDYARFAIQLFLQESVHYGVCAAYTHFYPVVVSQQALDDLLNVIQVCIYVNIFLYLYICRISNKNDLFHIYYI